MAPENSQLEAAPPQRQNGIVEEDDSDTDTSYIGAFNTRGKYSIIFLLLLNVLN